MSTLIDILPKGEKDLKDFNKILELAQKFNKNINATNITLDWFGEEVDGIEYDDDGDMGLLAFYKHIMGAKKYERYKDGYGFLAVFDKCLQDKGLAYQGIDLSKKWPSVFKNKNV